MELYYDDVADDVLIVKADGGLNARTADEFVRNIETMVDAGLRKMIVDCDKLDYVSSYGVGVLVRLHRNMELHNGDVKVAGLRSVVADVLRLTRLNRFFAIYPDVSQALLAFRLEDER